MDTKPDFKPLRAIAGLGTMALFRCWGALRIASVPVFRQGKMMHAETQASPSLQKRD